MLTHLTEDVENKHILQRIKEMRKFTLCCNDYMILGTSGSMFGAVYVTPISSICENERQNEKKTIFTFLSINTPLNNDFLRAFVVRNRIWNVWILEEKPGKR